MGELKNEMEDISLAEAPEVFGKSIDSLKTHYSSKSEPQLPTLSISAAPALIPKDRKAIFRNSVHEGAKVACIGGMILMLVMAAIGWPSGLVQDENTKRIVMSVLFSIGLLLVAAEDVMGINKSAIMLVLAAILWTLLAVGYSASEEGKNELHHHLNHGLQDVGSVILFLLPAMGLVESIDHFEGFEIVTVAIRKAVAGKPERLTAIICVMTFLLSSVIDNLTSTIVAIKILRHVAAEDDERRRYLGGLAVIAANAGGAWSPIGDVTTTMLWISGKITASRTVVGLLLPSLVTGLFPLVGIYVMSCRSCKKNGVESHVRRSKSGPIPLDEDAEGQVCELEEEPLRPELGDDLPEKITSVQITALSVGIFVILLVPVLKICTGLPPYLGMLLALGLMWLISDLLRFDPAPDNEKENQSTHRGVIAALYKVDLTGLLFFVGVLLSVAALDAAGVLHAYATMLVNSLGKSPVALCTLLGVSSAVVDNVPLVEASIDMFKDVPTDDQLWQLVALAAGTGGSILSVGSIAGVTLMSMEGVSFLWYAKRISPWAFLGFIFGIATYQVQHTIAGQ